MRFSEVTAVRRTAEDTFAVEIDPSSFIVRGPNGGFIAAVLLRAMTERLADPGRSARSLTVHYPAAPRPGPATITTEAVRIGRSLATLTARLEQGGQPMAVAIAAFSPEWPAPSFADLAAPRAVGPEQAPRRAETGTLPFIDYWDQRIAIGGPPGSVAETSETGGWLRLVDPEPIDAIVMAAMADAWVPAVFSRWANPNPVPTIDLTVHFRASLPTTLVAPDQHVLVHFRSDTLAEGFFEEDGEIWAPGGTLLAQSRQLAVVLPG